MSYFDSLEYRTLDHVVTVRDAVRAYIELIADTGPPQAVIQAVAERFIANYPTIKMTREEWFDLVREEWQTVQGESV